MKRVYAVVLTPAKVGFVVFIPDLDINTQGADIADAIEMARDAIGLWAINELDAGREISEPSLDVKADPDKIVTLIDIDIEAYRRANDMRTVRKNLTLPSWLNERAEKAGINFSQVLQESLKEQLGIYKSGRKD